MCYRSVQHIAVLELALLENVEKSSYVLGSELWESI